MAATAAAGTAAAVTSTRQGNRGHQNNRKNDEKSAHSTLPCLMTEKTPRRQQTFAVSRSLDL
jgi:hypothetical protein